MSLVRNVVVSAGPACVPEQVKDAVVRRILREQPCSLLETTDRSIDGRALLDEAYALIAALLEVPSEFTSLLLPGGGSQQFAMAALNTRQMTKKMNFVLTDYWAERAMMEFAQYMPVAACKADVGTDLDSLGDGLPEGEGIFLTSNNTACGTQWPKMPKLPVGCRIVDMSSDLFASKPDFGNVDIVIACAQKNFGVAGISLVILSESALRAMSGSLGGAFSYRSWVEADRLYNTFPIVPLAVTVEQLRYVQSIGGVEAVRRVCEDCSALLYGYLETSAVFRPLVPPGARSVHNVTFALVNDSVNRRHYVLEAAAAERIVGLKGHPAVGGFRASFYSGAAYSDAVTLVDALRRIELALEIASP